MVTCPRCGRPVDALHPIPAEVITRELVVTVGGERGLADLDVCDLCVMHLMDDG